MIVGSIFAGLTLFVGLVTVPDLARRWRQDDRRAAPAI